mgnify:CR=1 FL=1
MMTSPLTFTDADARRYHTIARKLRDLVLSHTGVIGRIVEGDPEIDEWGVEWFVGGRAIYCTIEDVDGARPVCVSWMDNAHDFNAVDLDEGNLDDCNIQNAVDRIVPLILTKAE